MLPARGSVTAKAKPTATAASMALPPSAKMRDPTALAISFCETTMPCKPTFGEWMLGYSSSVWRCAAASPAKKHNNSAAMNTPRNRPISINPYRLRTGFI